MTSVPEGQVLAGSAAGGAGGGVAWSLLRLARPHQWVKGAFVLIGPIYAGRVTTTAELVAICGAVLAFGFASSACYVVNDLKDAEADRAHPRKRHRPIAAGLVGPGLAMGFAVGLLVMAGLAIAAVWQWGPGGVGSAGVAAESGVLWLLLTLGLYVLNVLLYSFRLKHVVIMDVMCLALGFVLRVLGGCAAVMVEPSSWLLNVTFFVSMFLAFGKRLGERRLVGEMVAAARGVQASYTDALLQMVVVVTGVATLLTYAGYVQAQADRYTYGFNLLWLTMLPATYGLLRCIVLLEKGRFDDPTEIARKDRPFQLAGGLFVLMTAVLLWWFPMKNEGLHRAHSGTAVVGVGL